jgi:hypothetical protein
MNLADRQRETVARLLGGAAGEGEAVHAANIRATLTDSLRTSFPVTETLVGPDWFRRMAVAFIAAHPPSRPVLAEYGAELPVYLADRAAAEGLPYLADVARLEWLRQTAYFAADADPVTAEDLAVRSEAERLDLRLARRSGTGLLRSQYPIFSIWEAHRPGGPALESIDPAGAGECGAVYRKGDAVRHLPLDPVDEALLGALDGTTALGATLADLVRDFDGSALGAALARLLHAGLLRVERHGPRG